MRHGPSIVSSRYGTAPACFTPSLSTSVYAAITHAISRPSGTPRPGVLPRPRTSRTPSPTRQTPTTWPAEVVCPSATTPMTRTSTGAVPRDRIYDRELREPVRHRQEREVHELKRCAREDERDHRPVRVPEDDRDRQEHDLGDDDRDRRRGLDVAGARQQDVPERVD